MKQFDYIDSKRGIYDIKQFFVVSIIFFVALALYYTLTSYKEHIPLYLEQIRLMASAYYVLMILVCFYRMRVSRLLILNAVMMFVLLLLVKLTYERAGANTFNGAVDAQKYLNETLAFAHLSYGDFVEQIYNNRFDIHDLGNFTLNYIVYQIYPDKEFVIYGVAFFNIIFLYISSVYLFKLAQLFRFNDIISKLITILYAASPYALITISNGLKEVFFVMVIILAMYYICKAQREHPLKNILIAAPFIYGTNLFRGAIFYMVVLSAIVALTSKRENKKMYLLLMCIGAIVGGYFLPLFLETFLDRSQELSEQIINFRFRNRITSFSTSVFPYVAAFFGPYSNFDRLGTSGLTFVTSITMFIKAILSLWFVVGIFRIIKHYKEEYYPMLVYILASIAMLIQSGVSLDMRFHFTYLPFFFIVAFSGNIKHKYINYLYILIIVVICVLYCTRPVYSGTSA